MDLVSSIRKEGSRGGVDFKWSDVTTSTHRENYLGHSLMAPVGRWQKGRDLNWYAKADSKNAIAGETAVEKAARERKEEIKRIKEAEEDALARALGLPVSDRTAGNASGANAVDVGEMNRVIKETGQDDDELLAVGNGAGFGDSVGNMIANETMEGEQEEQPATGGLVRRTSDGRVERRKDRSQSRERHSRRHHRGAHSRDGDRIKRRDREGRHREHARWSRSPDRRHRRHRSQSLEARRRRRRSRSRSDDRHRDSMDERDKRDRRRSREPRPRRSRSPDSRRDRRSDRYDDRRR